MSKDIVYRQDVIDALTYEWDGMVTSVFDIVDSLPSAEPEKVCIARINLSEEQVREAVEKAKSEIIRKKVLANNSIFYD